MIRCDGTTITGELPAGWTAYLDRDWLRSDGMAAPAVLLRDADGALRWSPDGEVVAHGEDDAASAVIVGAAHAVADAVGSVDGRQVEVVGDGLLAAELRALLAADATPAEPHVVVDATGDADRLAAALGRVRTLGTVVLAGEPGDDPVGLDLYPDAHGRGLTIVGIPRRHHGPRATTVAPHRLRLGDAVPPDARWLHVTP